MQELPDKLLTLQQVAILTQTSKSAWQKRVTRKQIPVIRIGRSIRVATSDLEAFLQSNRKAVA